MKKRKYTGEFARRSGAKWFDKECRKKKQSARKLLGKYTWTQSKERKEAYNQARKDYKSTIAMKKRKHNNETCWFVLENTNNTPVFWKLVSRWSWTKREQPTIKIEEWETHFRTVFSGQSQAESAQMETKIEIPDLDGPISEHKVTEALPKLKCHKAAGLGEVLAELSKTCWGKFSSFPDQVF